MLLLHQGILGGISCIVLVGATQLGVALGEHSLLHARGSMASMYATDC